MLLAAIDENHKGTYDFLYLPIDFKVFTVFFHISIKEKCADETISRKEDQKSLEKELQIHMRIVLSASQCRVLYPVLVPTW